MSLEVRPVTAADRRDWLVLWQGYLDFNDTELPQAVTDATFTRIVDGANASMGGFLALRGDAAVGMVTYVLHPTTFATGDRCYLEDLFVAEAARGTGAGRALIEAVAGMARAHGCDKVYWQTAPDNEQGRRLYDRLARQKNINYEIRLS